MAGKIKDAGRDCRRAGHGPGRRGTHAKHGSGFPTAKKAQETALVISKAYGMDFARAYAISFALWEEAVKSMDDIVGGVGVENWKRLSFKDKALICSAVVRGLLNKEAVNAFLSGRRRRLV